MFSAHSVTGVAGGKIYNTAGAQNYEGDIGRNKKVIFTLDPVTKEREIVAEWYYNDTDLSLCNCPEPVLSSVF